MVMRIERYFPGSSVSSTARKSRIPCSRTNPENGTSLAKPASPATRAISAIHLSTMSLTTTASVRVGTRSLGGAEVTCPSVWISTKAVKSPISTTKRPTSRASREMRQIRSCRVKAATTAECSIVDSVTACTSACIASN